MNDTGSKIPERQNPLGVASVVLSALAFAVGLLVIFWVVTAQRERQAESNRIRSEAHTIEADRQTMEVYDTLADGLTVIEQVLVFGVGFCVGGTLAFVGFVLGLVGLSRVPRRTAAIGVLLSPAGPFALILFLSYCIAST